MYHPLIKSSPRNCPQFMCYCPWIIANCVSGIILKVVKRLRIIFNSNWMPFFWRIYDRNVRLMTIFFARVTNIDMSSKFHLSLKIISCPWISWNRYGHLSLWYMHHWCISWIIISYVTLIDCGCMLQLAYCVYYHLVTTLTSIWYFIKTIHD